jgi:hypothetical protein
MTAQNDRLGNKKRRALRALLAEPTIARAAKAASISERTLYRYMAEADFRAALRSAQGDMLGAAALRLSGLLQKALDVIGLDFEPAVDGRIRLTAAGLVLRHVAGLLEYMSLESRVSALENQSEGVKNGKPGNTN